VGVDLADVPGMQFILSFPHTRGGGPITAGSLTISVEFSPHAWGWTDNFVV